MAFVAAKCTQCGGSLQVDDSKEAGICPFCGTAFITEKVINNYNYHITNNIDTVIVQNSQKLELKERCQGYLEAEDYNVLCEIAYKAIEQYPNEIFFYACYLWAIMRLNQQKIGYIGIQNFNFLLEKAKKFQNHATDWERKVLVAAEEYRSNKSLLIGYASLTTYYQFKYRINYDKAQKLNKKKNVIHILKKLFLSVRSIFLFWIPLILLIGLVIFANVFGNIELGASSPLLYISIAVVLYGAVGVIGTLYGLITTIRENIHFDEPVEETLSDYLNGRIRY